MRERSRQHFLQGLERGAQCVAYLHGEKVVDCCGACESRTQRQKLDGLGTLASARSWLASALETAPSQDASLALEVSRARLRA